MIPHIHNKINVDNINTELKNTISAAKLHAEEYDIMTSNIMQKISLQKLRREWWLCKKINTNNRVYTVHVIYTKWTLIKAKAENSNHRVTRNMSYFHRILNDGIFSSNTTYESNNDFEYTRYDNIDNQNHNNRCSPLQNLKLPSWNGTAFEH